MTVTRYQTIFIANDHGGLEMKRHLIRRFPALPWKDLGTDSDGSVDYPDYAKDLAQALIDHPTDACGVLVCGSGQGMAIQANRFPHIRAALCWNELVAKLAREHNDANVLCLAGRLTDFSLAEKILATFLATSFEGGRHQKRIDKLNR